MITTEIINQDEVLKQTRISFVNGVMINNTISFNTLNMSQNYKFNQFLMIN